MGKKILIVDDEAHIRDILKYNLVKDGYETIEAADGEEAINMALKMKPDLIILDVMLPKFDGFTVCRRLRPQLNVPILMLTAKEDVVDKIIGLELGADDYMTKPFSVRELMARVKANLRKFSPIPTEEKKEEKKGVLILRDLIIDSERYFVKKGDKAFDLTIKEFELIKFLVTNKEQVFSREQILENVWGYDYYGDVRTVDVTVRRLRDKLGDDSSNPEYIHTKRGIGYYVCEA